MNIGTSVKEKIKNRDGYKKYPNTDEKIKMSISTKVVNEVIVLLITVSVINIQLRMSLI